MPNETVLLVLLPDGRVDGVYDALDLTAAHEHKALLGPAARVERVALRASAPKRKGDGSLDYA